MIIDMHTHAWPEKVSQKARQELEGLFKITFADEPTPKSLLLFMDKNNIDVSVVCAVASKQEQVSSINNWLFGLRSPRLKIFCSLHPDYPYLENELKRIKQNGDGIKLHPEFQDFDIDGGRAFPIYEQAQELGLPILFHCGQELSETMYVRSSPQGILNVRKRFPRLKIIAAHFGGFRLWDEVKKYLLGEDIYLDTSFFFGFLSKREIKSLILGHRPERLLFGTDFPLVDQEKDITYLNALNLPPELKERIFYRNAKELLAL